MLPPKLFVKITNLQFVYVCILKGAISDAT